MPSVTLFFPALLRSGSPDPGSVAEPSLPALEVLLARGVHSSAECDDEAAWLCRRFGITPQADWPVAALSVAGDGIEPGDAFWLRADPVHLDVRNQHLILQPTEDLEISAEESGHLARSLHDYFSAEDLHFVHPAPQRWYLRLPASPDLRTVPVNAAAGRDVDRLLPQGRDRMRWHRLFNETQMLLHHHPVNAAREQHGLPVVNSLWFWGGGRLPEVSRQFDSVVAHGSLLRGLAHAAGLTALEDASYQNPESGRRLVELPPVERDQSGAAISRELLQLEQRWFAPALAALRAGRLDCIELATTLAGHSHAWTLTRREMWRIWRRPVRLARYASQFSEQDAS